MTDFENNLGLAFGWDRDRYVSSRAMQDRPRLVKGLHLHPTMETERRMRQWVSWHCYCLIEDCCRQCLVRKKNHYDDVAMQ